MQKLQDIPGDHLIQIHLGDEGATAGTAYQWTGNRVPFRCVVTSVAYVSRTAVTGAATNNFTAQLTNRGQAGAGSTAVASATFANGTNTTAHDEFALTLSGTAANLQLEAGDILSFDKVVNGTGLAMPAGRCIVTVQAR